MGYGWKEVVNRAGNLSVNFDHVRVSRSLSEPHIFWAFYTKADPKQYQEATPSWLVFEDKGLKFLDQYDGYNLGKFRFGDLHLGDFEDSTLLIGRPQEFPANYPEHFHVDFPNGQPAIKVAPLLP
jgi:hypothetical protein